MKIRHDFVSNSSSSSFVIHNEDGSVQLFFLKFSEMFSDIDYFDSMWTESLTFSIRCKNKDYIYLWNNLVKDEDHKECPYEDTYDDWYTKKTMKKDPEEISYDGINFGLADICKIANRNDIVSKICEIYISTYDDYSSIQVQQLAKMYRFLHKLKCNPDCTHSEQDFLNDNYDEFGMKIEKFMNS